MRLYIHYLTEQECGRNNCVLDSTMRHRVSGGLLDPAAETAACLWAPTGCDFAGNSL